MNRRRYRKNNYRKKRLKNIIIISVSAIIVLFIIFLAVGLSLAEKTKDYEIEYDDVEYTDAKKKSTRKVAEINAYPLPLLEDGSSFSSRLSGIKENATAVSMALNRSDGTLLYRSDLASSFSYLTAPSDAQNLSSCVKNINDKDLYTTAMLYVPTFEKTDDDLKADVELSIWGSIACEAIRAGVGDVLLITNGANEEDIDKLCALADRIHITEEKAIIGLTLTKDILDSEKSVSYIDELSKAFDYLAFDATNIKGEGTLLENTEAAIADMQLQLMYYKMRVLLPRCANTEELDSLANIVTKHSINSWQALTQ